MTTAQSTGTLLSRRDMQFLLYDWLKAGELAGRERFEGQSRELYDDVLGLAEQVATEQFAPHYRTADAQEPYIGEDGKVVLPPEVEPALQTLGETGLIGAGMDASVGGMQLPAVITTAAFAWLYAANVPTSGYSLLAAAAANLLMAWGSEEQQETWVSERHIVPK